MKDDLAPLAPVLNLHVSLPSFFEFLLCSLYVGVFGGGSGLRWVQAKLGSPLRLPNRKATSNDLLG